MKSFLFYLTCCTFLISSCNITDIGSEDYYTILPQEVTVLNHTPQMIEFQITNGCASFCIKKPRTIFEREGNIFKISVVAESTLPKSKGACPAACLQIEESISISIYQSGEYNFQFLYAGKIEKEFTYQF